MLRELLARGVAPDFVVGTSVGAINGAYLAGAPDLDGVKRLEAIWRGLRQTRRWLQRGGLEKRRIPGALRPHDD